MSYFSIRKNQLVEYPEPPTGSVPFGEGIQRVLPPQIGTLHQEIHAWGQLGVSPGPLDPQRIWLTPAGEMSVRFSKKNRPDALMQIGAAPDLAAWLVLLDVWMETFVVVARARAVWSVDELASALTFMTPAYLPNAVLTLTPQWARMAQAVAQAVADGPLAGSPEDRHWTEKG